MLLAQFDKFCRVHSNNLVILANLLLFVLGSKLSEDGLECWVMGFEDLLEVVRMQKLPKLFLFLEFLLSQILRMLLVVLISPTLGFLLLDQHPLLFLNLNFLALNPLLLLGLKLSLQFDFLLHYKLLSCPTPFPLLPPLSLFLLLHLLFLLQFSPLYLLFYLFLHHDLSLPERPGSRFLFLLLSSLELFSNLRATRFHSGCSLLTEGSFNCLLALSKFHIPLLFELQFPFLLLEPFMHSSILGSL